VLRRPVPALGKADALWEETVKCTTKAAGVWVLTSRICTAISPYLWLIGIPILIYFTFTSFNPILVLIIILGCVQLYKLWKGTEKDYYNIPAKTRNLFAVLYFGLLASLGGGVYYTLQILGTSRIH
jgi:putative Mn2+ efflux pump MntP